MSLAEETIKKVVAAINSAVLSGRKMATASKIAEGLSSLVKAEDVLHETLMTVLRAPADFSRGTFKAWGHQVARNACLNRLRARRRGEAARGRFEAAPVEPPLTAAEALEAGETAHALARAVAALPRPLGELYRLRASGLSYEELATVLELPLGTVKSRMHDMVKQLQKEMRAWTARE